MFYSLYNKLTREQIAKTLEKAGPAPSRSALCGDLAGKSMRILLDNGPSLDYTFSSCDKLTFKEDGGQTVQCAYSALKIQEIVLFTHMIPGTLRGFHGILDTRTELATVFEVWFCGYEQDNREVHRQIYYGYIDSEPGKAPEARHTLTNRVEGKGLYWKDDRGVETLTFYPSVIWSSFVELSNPRGGITITAPSDFIKINDRFYIYSRVECEYSGTMVLEVIDLMTVSQIGLRLGFDENDALDYIMYTGTGEFTGQSTNFEPMTDYGTEIPFSGPMKEAMSKKGARAVYRPRKMHSDMTKEQVDERIKNKSLIFEGTSIMSSKNTMEISDYMVDKTFTLRFDNGGPAWEYEITDIGQLRWRPEGDKVWQTERYQAFEPAKDIILFSHIITGSNPLRCLTNAVDFSNGLVTCVDAQIGNEWKIWEVGHKAIFGILEMEGGVTPPAIRRHGFTTDLVGKAYSWTYSDTMQSIHVYSSPESYSWTIFLPRNAGGFMWSSPCLYVKLREDAYLFSWTEDTCNGNQGTMVFNPRLMHDAGFFFGFGDDDLHLSAMGAYARPASGFDILRYFELKQK